MKKNISVSGELGWLKRLEFCVADLDVEVKNISKSDVEVKEIRGQAWLIDEPSPDQKGIVYSDILGEVDRKKPIETFTYLRGPLVQSYSPGQSSHHTFEWVVKPQINTNALFLIEAFGAPNEKDLLDHHYQWDLVCGENIKEGGKKTD